MLGRPSFGLIGRLFAILLLTVVIEFGASTLLYERASRLNIREDEARRVAEQLAVSHRLLAERPRSDRAELADQLSTGHLLIRWHPEKIASPPIAPPLDEMRTHMIAWEPALAKAGLKVKLVSPGRDNRVSGTLQLPDGTWLSFTTFGLVDGTALAPDRIVLALVPAIALIAIGGLLVRIVLIPMRMLAQAAGRVGHGDSIALAEAGSSEMRRVIRAFNDMQARIHQLIANRTQALAAVSHDLRTPLARLRLRAEAIEEEELRKAVDADIAEMDAMIASLLAFFGGENDPEKPARIDIAVLAATIADDAADRGHEARYSGVAHLDAFVRPLSIKRAIANLVENGLHYGDAVEISAGVEEGRIFIRIDDQGPGIPPDALDRVMQPFERLDPARARNTDGLGLGLPIVARAVEREEGTLRLLNRPEGGLRAEIILPRQASATLSYKVAAPQQK
ncbi:two-component sensor histidine kinase [Sphingomonas oleivorans]|uniref:histidine kinase n=2 Tax=Sphingomonas oleivorans TaxID=1735121 RepID=A0A2T5FXV6_9SPHN|nr:ATP-binding protein [Sphingomonas oleivorans]PTQ10970.1 two-component sensor histidine kinase [Sphingomonas oleivorans]